MPNLKSVAWCVAYRKSEDKEFCIVKNPIWGWAADPFLIERKGIMFIFAELWDYRKGKGGIGYITIQNGKIGKWKMIIEESYHLSYPHFVEIDNQLYICPEIVVFLSMQIISRYMGETGSIYSRYGS